MEERTQTGQSDPADMSAILIERNRRIAGYAPRPLPGQDGQKKPRAGDAPCAG